MVPRRRRGRLAGRALSHPLSCAVKIALREPSSRKPPDVSGAGLLLRGPPLSPGVMRGVGTTSRDPLPRAPLSVGASAAEWEILDGKRVDLQSGAPGPARAPAGPGSGPCRARLARPAGPGLPLPGPARALCRARLATPGPKRPNQQVEERGGPGEEKTGPATEPWSDSLTATPGQRLTVPDSPTALTALSPTV